MQKAVAIIGLGARYPGAPDGTAFRRLIRTGSVQVQPVPAERWDHSVVYSPSRRQANRTPARTDQWGPRINGVGPLDVSLPV